MELGQRRSLRILLSIPVLLQGMDEDGSPFESAGRTIALNRHDARIQAKHRLRPGQTIAVTNQSSGAQADFRVVGPLAFPYNQVGEWGIECLRADENIWKIYFPPLDGESDAHILLECRHCHALTLQSLSLVEVEVLETAGLLTKSCAPCGKSTPWGYPPENYEAGTQPGPMAAGGVTGDGSPWVVNRRKDTASRHSFLSACVITSGRLKWPKPKTSPLTASGFSAFREYHVGQGIVVTCPSMPPCKSPKPWPASCGSAPNHARNGTSTAFVTTKHRANLIFHHRAGWTGSNPDHLPEDARAFLI